VGAGPRRDRSGRSSRQGAQHPAPRSPGRRLARLRFDRQPVANHRPRRGLDGLRAILMWPTITEVQTALGPWPVNTYGLFIMLAFSGAFTWVHFRARQQGIDPDRMIGAYLCAAVFGMLGGRLMYAFTVDWEHTGFAVYGGLIGGAVGVGVFAHWAG